MYIRNIPTNILKYFKYSYIINTCVDQAHTFNYNRSYWTPIQSFVKTCIPKLLKFRQSYLKNYKATKVLQSLEHNGNPSSCKGFPKALVFSFSIPFFGMTDEDKKGEEVITMMKLAILAVEKGEDSKAEQLLHVALKAAQEMNDDHAITYIYDMMANFALQRHDFKKAEKLFIDVLKRFIQDGMADDDNALVDVSLKLASIYSNLGDNEKACEGFQFCIGTQDAKMRAQGVENVDEDTLVLWAMSHDWFARFLLNLGHYDRAREHFTKAFEVCIKIKGENDPQTAVLLNDLGSVSSLQQRYDEAINYMNRAIDIGKETKSEDLASFYVNLGTIYMQKQVYDYAEEYCHTGMKIAKAEKNEEALMESEKCLDTLMNLTK